MMDPNIFPYLIIVLMIVLMIVSNLLILYIKGYSNEKGKNLATKEDIEDITRKIENVKVELQHSYSQKRELVEKHKFALIDFLEQFNKWVGYSMREISVVDNIFEVDPIRKVITEIYKQKNLVEKSF